MNTGAYIHIPFCGKKCDYCGFYSVPVGHLSPPERAALIRRYIDRLCGEINSRANEMSGCVIDTIYFGGGTPSLLEPSDVARINAAIRDNYRIEPVGIEVTLECNPDDFSAQKINAYRDAGINRVVLGVQTMHAKLHSVIGRSASLVQSITLEEFCGMAGITHCVDIITGIPGQTREMLIDDIHRVCAYRPEHISAYILSIESGTSLCARMRMSEELELSQKDLFRTTMRLLREKGYAHYEVSNFALPGFESKHNMKYWLFQPYIGFGVRAHSFYGNERYYNNQTVDEYLAGAMPARVRDVRTVTSAIAEYVMTATRLIRGMSLRRFKDTLGREFPADIMDEFISFEKQGLVSIIRQGDDTVLAFTEEGMFYMDGLLYRALEKYI